jgi:hypothetical protein
MVAVATASSVFEARLLAARLTAEGIPCELRGNIDGPYPVGPVQVLVSAVDADDVRELLLVDEVEEVFESGAWDGSGRTYASARDVWVLAAIVVGLLAFVLVRILSVPT